MRHNEHLSALATGARLNIYVVERVLGAGGFGITYRAREDITERVVAIKEYLPSSLAVRARDGASVRPISESVRTDFDWGLGRFRDEAKLLIGMKHPNIVPVLSYFEANGTGYLVMEFQAGRSLGDMVANGGTLGETELLGIVEPLLDGVEAVHKHGFLHRDIKPDNIFVRADGSPVLLDFGAARQALGRHSRSLTAVLTEGYAPYEQYHRDGNQGPWTDIYAFGAVMFRCLLGAKPAEAPQRVDARFRDAPDPLAEDFVRLRTVAAPATCRAIEAALSLREGDRPQSIAALRVLLRPQAAPEASAASSTPATLLARPPPASGRESTDVSARAPRRGRLVAYAAAGAVLFAAAAFGAYMVAGGDRPDAAQVGAAREAEEAKRRADAQRKADEEKARLESERRRQEQQRAKAEEEAKRKAEAETVRRRADEDARRKAEEEKARAERARLEAEQRKKAEEEAGRKAEEERAKAEAKRKADEAKKAERERADAEAKRKAEAEAKQKAERVAALAGRARDRLAAAATALRAKRLLEAKRLAAEAGAALSDMARIDATHAELAALRRQHEALDAEVKRDIAARVTELVRSARDAIKANRAAEAKQRLDQAALLDPGSSEVAAARRELAMLGRGDQPGAPGARHPRAQLTQMVYQRIMASSAHSVTMYKGAEHTRALYACVDWNASTPQNVIVHGYGYGYKWNSASRARDTGLQYCRPHQGKGCECTLVDETSGAALTLPGAFAAKYSN